MKGIVFNIQKFCTNDGPGIRTTVFLKGCPLRCAWCHNPESQKGTPELLFDAEKCVACGRCTTVCPTGAHRLTEVHTLDRAKCIACGNCCSVCPADALELAGQEMSVEEVLDEVMKDKIFYDHSGGGLTLSGGEPLIQFEFALALLKEAKEHGIHTCVETCGYISADKIRLAAEYVDMFLYDWKITNDDRHKRYTGVSNTQIRENLRIIAGQGVPIILRCPIIPDVNDTQQHFMGIGQLAETLSTVSGIEIEPYHALGNSKYVKVSGERKATVFRTPTESEIVRWTERIQALTDMVVRKA